jgi:flagellar motor switch protein FliN
VAWGQIMSVNPRPRLVQHIETSLSQALGCLTGADFRVTAQQPDHDPGVLDEPIVWQQSFSVMDGPSLWIVAGRDLWHGLGTATLEAAGIDSVTEDDCRSTWQEIVQQTMAGIASGISADQDREVTAGKGELLGTEPRELTWLEFSVTASDNRKWSFKLAWDSELAGNGVPQIEETRSPVVRENAISKKTFDLLLDVALPVSISFGKTSLQIREVLKLNTGSIVELNRFVTDPVEVIVNDCVIARGEVVVVDGNYGVRIIELASREDRMRSGVVEASHKAGPRL